MHSGHRSSLSMPSEWLFLRLCSLMVSLLHPPHAYLGLTTCQDFNIVHKIPNRYLIKWWRQPLVLKVSVLQIAFLSPIFPNDGQLLNQKASLSHCIFWSLERWYWLPAKGKMLAETYWWLSSLISHGLKHHSLANFSCWDDSSKNTIFKRKRERIEY